MITKDEAEKFVHGLFSDVWCARNKDAVSTYYHPEFLGLLHGEEEFRYEDVLKRVDYSKAHFDNPHVIFNDIFVTDDQRIIARVEMDTINRETQQEETLKLMAIIEMKDGKMYRQWTLSSKPYRYKDWD